MNVIPIRPRDPVLDLILAEEALRTMARSYQHEADALAGKIRSTKATTIAGVMALLRLDHIDAGEIAIESLRELAR
jgi:hypothetical protein